MAKAKYVSEQLRRIQAPQIPQKSPPITSDEINRQIESFLANGGKIEVLPYCTENTPTLLNLARPMTKREVRKLYQHTAKSTGAKIGAAGMRRVSS